MGNDRLLIRVDRRELATILAALRFHQDENLQGGGEIPDVAIRDIADDGGTLVPMQFDEIDQLCQRIKCDAKPSQDKMNGGTISSCNEGLMIGRPPSERGDHPLFRVVYVIDIGAKGMRQAAETAYEIMADPRSQPPLFHVINVVGAVVIIDLTDQ